MDGIFGPITQSSVVAFQRLFGMTPSGVVNQTTWNLIVSMRNLLAPAGSVFAMAVSDEAFTHAAPAEDLTPGAEAMAKAVPQFFERPLPQNFEKLAWMLAVMLLSER